MRIAGYTRISTDEEHQLYSLEAQAQRLAAYVQSQEGWRLVRRFSDQTSGATLERPGLQRALQEAQAKRFDLLLVYRVDRLSRSVRGLAQLLEQLDQAGVLFRSASEPFDTSSSAGRMMVQMLGVFAEFERATIVERVIAGMERKAARGEWMGGSLPFGYRLDAERRHLEPDATEAPVVREIFERYAERLEGSSALASWLSERGHRTKNDKPFNPQAVLTILRNRAYLGQINFRGQSYPAPHEPLIHAELFERAQAILSERGEDASLRRSNRSDYLLTGLLKCCAVRQALHRRVRARKRRPLLLLRLLLTPAIRQEHLRRRLPPGRGTRARAARSTPLAARTRTDRSRSNPAGVR
jgi:site-specific DNA recombinase